MPSGICRPCFGTGPFRPAVIWSPASFFAALMNVRYASWTLVEALIRSQSLWELVLDWISLIDSVSCQRVALKPSRCLIPAVAVR